MPAIRDALAQRLSKCIGGLHFQVAERALLLWNSDRFSALMLEHSVNRAAVFPVLYSSLYTNQEAHWHESIRTLSGHVLDQYADVDPPLAAACRGEYEARAAVAAAAADAAAAAAATVAAGSVRGADGICQGGDTSAVGIDAETAAEQRHLVSGGSGSEASVFDGGETPPLPRSVLAAAAAAAGGPVSPPPLIARSTVSAGVSQSLSSSSAAAPSTPRGPLPPPLAASAAASMSSPMGASAGALASPSLHAGAVPGVHAHKAPAVRGSTQFAVTSDILPGHHATRTPKKFSLPFSDDLDSSDGPGE